MYAEVIIVCKWPCKQHAVPWSNGGCSVINNAMSGAPHFIWQPNRANEGRIAQNGGWHGWAASVAQAVAEIKPPAVASYHHVIGGIVRAQLVRSRSDLVTPRAEERELRNFATNPIVRPFDPLPTCTLSLNVICPVVPLQNLVASM